MKNLRKLFGVFLVVMLSVNIAMAEEKLTITWDDLIPEEFNHVDILEQLEEEERGAVEQIIYFRQVFPEGTKREDIDPDNLEYFDLMISSLPLLKGKGYDVEKIIAERLARTTAINKSLDGKNVEIAGYFLPLNFDGEKVVEFLLVPWVGACVHTPPPPINQIVFAKIVKGDEYVMEDMYRPVVVTGILSAQATSKDLFLVDGSADFDIGYSIEEATVKTYIP